MARKLRIQFPGAIYHLINRGNYRRDLFFSVGEAQAFLDAVREAQAMMGWRVHAYALMRNHYHLAVETPEPNLVSGMHWLQTTWATRFNRFRQERGHLFQGRYQSVLVEDSAALGRVVDYIHLNPVRARIGGPDQVRHYRWTSLAGIVRGDSWGDDRGWRAEGRFAAEDGARAAYERFLIALARDEASWEARGLTGLSHGWAIGTAAWRRKSAEEHGRLALAPGLARAQGGELREAMWEKSLREELAAAGREESELATRPMRQAWKLRVAARTRQKTGASIGWLARRMQFGRPATLRTYLCRQKAEENQQTTA